jgi:hypothetical protein
LFFAESALFAQLISAIVFETGFIKKFPVVVSLTRCFADQFFPAAADAEPGHLWFGPHQFNELEHAAGG